MIAFAGPSRPAGVGSFVLCLCHRAASFTYFGKVLRCPHSHHNENVHRKKQHTRGNNTIPYKLARLVTFESLK